MDFLKLFTGTKPRVRMAPSPTGNLHIGTARTTLFNYLFARHHGGTFVMRIEDTDKQRSTPEFEKNILDGLQWLGLSWDEFYRQSERTDIYKAALSRLVDENKAYVSREPGKDDPSKEVEVVRLRNPGKPVTFSDIVRGDITTDTTDLGDFVIARAIDDPLYHLAVVVDDGEMGITHVIRGEDHISNTARQILILEALGFARPQYVHLPLILAPDRSKMSKRHGAISLDEYRAMGFIPEALINFLALMGWNPGGEQEVFTLPELVEEFDIDKLHKSGAVFNMEKLLWYNREHLKTLSDEEFLKRLPAGTPALDPRALPLLRERVATLKEAADLIAEGEFSYLTEAPTPAPAMLIPKTKGGEAVPAEIAAHLTHVAEALAPLSSWSAAEVKDAVWAYAEEKGKSQVLWPMRVALTGKEKSPDPFTVAELLGKEETISRIKAACASL